MPGRMEVQVRTAIDLQFYRTDGTLITFPAGSAIAWATVGSMSAHGQRLARARKRPGMVLVMLGGLERWIPRAAVAPPPRSV